MSAGRWLASAALFAALAFVFADQPRDDGFRRGHRGWVSAHTLAIIEKSTQENGYVGYTMALSTETARDLYYFNRYPVFFAAGMKVLEDAFADTRLERIRVARHAMNAIYALTIVMAAVLLVELGLPLEVSIAAAALAGASGTMVSHRDMVHFDQPALLGIVVLLWTIARRQHGGSSWLVLAATALAVSAGRGYACFPVLGIWWILDAAGRIASAGRSSLRPILAGVPTLACVLAISIAAACIAYNVTTEARIRGVAAADAGILRSAGQRLALDEGFNDRKEKRLAWNRVLQNQRENLARSVTPVVRRDPAHRSPLLRDVLAAAVLLVAFVFAARQRRNRVVWLVACAAGPVWMLAMRNLVAFHPYTAVYLFPLCLVFFAALVHRLRGPAGVLAAVAASALLGWSTAASHRQIEVTDGNARRDTRDMMAIERRLGPRDPVATDGQIFRGVPYALGFYLPRNDVVVEGPASLVISRRKSFPGENLTPDNAGVFLFRPDDRHLARSSLAKHHRASKIARYRAVRREDEAAHRRRE